MTDDQTPDRTVLRVEGADAFKFLQDAVTNDLHKLDAGLVYAAILTAQGKYLFDFFVLQDQDALLVDIHTSQADAFAARMSLYKLRADVSFVKTALRVARGVGDAPPNALPDPRHPALGWRRYGAAEDSAEQVDWTALRVDHCIPETGLELIPEKTLILEAGFERLNGVDFRKGCYIGQEVTARMKHKTELRKGLVTVALDAQVPFGTEITRDGKAVGTIYSQSGNKAIAFLRHDRAGSDMRAGGVAVTLA